MTIWLYAIKTLAKKLFNMCNFFELFDSLDEKTVNEGNRAIRTFNSAYVE